MSNLENQYYVIFPDSTFVERPIYFDFDRDAGRRRASYNELSIEDGPVHFQLDTFLKTVTSEFNPLSFSLPNIIIHNSILGELSSEGIYGGRLFPAVYDETEQNKHEGYFLINIFEELDCWDRKKSTYEPDEGDTDVSMQSYRLNEDKLLAINESERLIFRMGGVSRPLNFVHEKIIEHFKKNNIQGFKIFKVNEYEFGMEFSDYY